MLYSCYDTWKLECDAGLGSKKTTLEEGCWTGVCGYLMLGSWFLEPYKNPCVYEIFNS